MKKKVLTLAASVMVLFTAAFGQNTNHGTNEKIATAFTKEFARATNVKWEVSNAYIKGNFELNGQNIAALFTKDGGFIGVVRHIRSTDLPINLKTSLDKNYSGFWISDLFELAKDGASRYYATIENADKKIILESVGANAWSRFKAVTKVN